VYIKDNGSGAASGAGAGFNLDAVEMLTLPLSADFTATTTSPCAGMAVDFTDLSNGNPTSWEWEFPGGTPASSNVQNPVSIRYETPGIYNVSLSVSNGSATASKTKTGFINAGEAPMVRLGNDTSICAWNTILLDAGNPGMVYLWSTSATTQTIVADSAGTGVGSTDYWVQVTNPAGCHATDTIGITFDNCTASPDLTQYREVTIAPNPSSGRVMLTIRGFDQGQWQFLSMEGSILEQSEINGENYKTIADFHSFPAGIYLLKVQKNEKLVVKKIMIAPSQAR
jgi:PKD repeat protein